MSYSFRVTCPECGGPVEHVTSGTSTGRDTRAVIACTTCRRVELVTVTLATISAPTRREMPPTRRLVAECGTDSGYFRHLRAGAKPCPSCKAAHSDAEKQRRRAKREAAA